jgi:hypothetical protein
MRTIGVSILCAIGVLAAAYAAEAVTCETNLAGHSYACDVKDQNGNFHQDCFKFFPSDLGEFIAQSGLPYGWGCSCRATGTFTTPHFDKSPSDFICVWSGTDHNEALVGHVVNPNLNIEITTDVFGFHGYSYWLKCHKVPSC